MFFFNHEKEQDHLILRGRPEAEKLSRASPNLPTLRARSNVHLNKCQALLKVDFVFLVIWIVESLPPPSHLREPVGTGPCKCWIKATLDHILRLNVRLRLRLMMRLRMKMRLKLKMRLRLRLKMGLTSKQWLARVILHSKQGWEIPGRRRGGRETTLPRPRRLGRNQN